MTATIAYDLPMKNLIDELSATGHVTHKSYRKTSVTIHHNAGRLSHEGVLRVWRTRPASAHFDIDRQGDACQYVKVNEYAWATGNTEGNMRSISIEMANSTLSPDWLVAEVTWKAAARLAGWLFARIIGERPSRSNLFFHHHWRNTTCAGPYMDTVYEQMLAEAQRAYDRFRAGGSGGSSAPTPRPRPSGKLAEDGLFGPATTRRFQQLLRTTVDGVISHQSYWIRRENPGLAARGNWEFDGTGKGSQAIRAHQRLLKGRGLYRDRIDGLAGPNYWHAVQRSLGLDLPANDREISDPSATVRRLQHRMNAGKLW